MRRLACLVLLPLALGACRSERPAPPAEPAPAAAPAPSSPSAKPGALARRPAPDGLAVDPSLAPALAAIERTPGRADAWIALGRAWVLTARLAQREDLYDRVEDAARAALARAPQSAEARHLIGLVLRTRHRFAELRTLATQMTAAAPTDDSAWGLLADAALALGDYGATAAAIDRMLDLRPGLPAYSRAAWLRWLHGDADGAIEMWREALGATGPRGREARAWTLTEMGHVEWNRGRLDAADALYTAALRALPTHAGALFGRGRIALARGDAPAAVEALAASSAARPLEQTTEWHALALRAAGDAAAADALDAKLAAAGSFDDDRSVALYLATHRLTPAVAVARAREDFAERQGIYAHDALGWALYRAGELETAADHLAQATRLGTPDPLLHAHRGLVAAARGQTDEARAHLDRALALNPHAHPLVMAEVKAAREKL